MLLLAATAETQGSRPGAAAQACSALTAFDLV